MEDIRVDYSRFVNIRAYRGATFNKNFSVKDGGADYDFTDHVVTLEVFNTPADKTPNLLFNIADGLTLTAGNITLLKSASVMDALRSGKYFYRLWVTNVAGVKALWLNGYFFNEDGVADSQDAAATTTIQLSVNGTSVEIEVITVGKEFLTTLVVDTSGSPIVLDFTGTVEKMFIGSAPFSGAKVISLTNTGSAKVFSLQLETDVANTTLTLPSSFVMDKTDTRFNTASQVLTLAAVGKYELGGLWDSVNNEWKFKCSPNGGYA